MHNNIFHLKQSIFFCLTSWIFTSKLFIFELLCLNPMLYRCKHMDQMQWLMRKIVFSSYHIVREVEFVNLPSFFSWKEQVRNLFHYWILPLFLMMEIGCQAWHAFHYLWSAEIVLHLVHQISNRGMLVSHH